MTTAGSARSSSTCTRKVRRCAPSSTILRSRFRSACNTACRWKNMSMPSPSPASSRRARCRATTPSSMRPRSSTMSSANSRSATCRASTSPMSIPSESNFDAMGKGVEEGRAPENSGNKYLSKGLTRSRSDNLVVMRGGSAAVSAGSDSAPSGGSKVTSLSPAHGSHAPRLLRHHRRRGRAEAGGATRPVADGEARGAAMEQGRRAAASTPRPPKPNAAPKRRPKATKARCARSAAILRWCGMAPA